MSPCNSGSAACSQLAVAWLENCLSNHSDTCLPNTESLFPTRLVDVSPPESPGSLRLVSSKGGRGKYLALSYCWGQDPFFTLNTGNKADLEQSVPMDPLPRTVKDAIILTRRLNVRYIWIDSLCILQGVDEKAVKDWEAESLHMNTIYGGAFLTIMAAGAQNAHRGLFHDRNVSQASYCKVTNSHDSDAQVYLTSASVQPLPGSFEPLHQRGWAYQENYISNRSLSYGSLELSWTCRGAKYRERVAESASRVGQGIRR